MLSLSISRVDNWVIYKKVNHCKKEYKDTKNRRLLWPGEYETKKMIKI